MDMNKVEKYIELDKRVFISYDILVLCVGLIDTELQVRKINSFGLKFFAPHPYLEARRFIDGVFSINDPYLYKIFSKEIDENIPPKSHPISLMTRKKSPCDIVVYGRSLNVFSFINGLIERGVKGWRITLVIPCSLQKLLDTYVSFKDRKNNEDLKIFDPDPFEDPEIHEKIENLYRSIGVKILRNRELLEINEENGVLSSLFFKKHDLLEEDEEEVEEISARFLLTSGIVDIDNDIFHIIHEHGLVYNGRLIIQGNFQTTDPSFFACGRICEFSQRYKNVVCGTNLRLDKYNGRELGQKLAISILKCLELEPNLDLRASIATEEELPTFTQPLGIGAVLVKGLKYYRFVQKDWIQLRNTDLEKQNSKFISSNCLEKDFSGHILKFEIDHNSIITAVTYLGKEEVFTKSLASFLGLSESYLNNLQKRFPSIDSRMDAGIVVNAAEFLSENWAIALYHEFFSELRYISKTHLASNSQISELMEEIQKKGSEDQNLLTPQFLQEKISALDPKIEGYLRNTLIDFIKNNSKEFPMYVKPSDMIKY